MLIKPSSCIPCALNSISTGFLKPEVDEAVWRSPRSTRVLIVGEGGGKTEAAEGLPFRPAGQAGAVLTRCLKEAGFDRSQFAFANLVMCQPPNNDLDGASYEHEAIRHCAATQLDGLVARLAPRAILMAGGLPTKHLAGVSGKKQGIRMVHGYAFDTIYGVPGVACFHPAFLSRGAMELVPTVAFAIQRAVTIARDGYPRYDAHYCEMPSPDDAEEFARRVASDPAANLAVDIETDESASLDEDDLGEDFGRFVKTIQFSLARREGISMPWVEPFVDIARRVLAGPNRKIGHNIFRFDAPRLRAAGMILGGDIDDTLWMWKAFQPDLPGHLQFVSAMCGFPGPAWKHMSTVNLAQYGCADVDVLQWIYPVLCAGMKARQCEAAYWRYQKRQDPILVAMTGRGIPVVESKRQVLAAEIVTLKDKLIADIQQLVPDELRTCSPKNGYVRAPTVKCPACGGKKPKKARGKGAVQPEPCLTCKGDLRVPATEGLVEREFATPDGPTKRWCRLEPWNPNSSPQVLDYVKWRGHKVPIVRGTDGETSDKKSLHRLARQTGDPLYRSIIDYREMTKMGSAFVDGWASGEDGKVHPQFWVSTAVLQLTSRNPNALQIPTPKGDSVKDVLAARFRDMIEAPEGRRIVEFDMCAFHAQTLAFNAGDATYLWAAKHDVHSFVTAHFLKLPEKDDLTRRLQDASSKHRIDPDLLAMLSKIKKTYSAVRNRQCKAAVLAIGFGAGVRKIYELNDEHFASESEVRTVMGVIRGLWPKIFAWQDAIRKEAHLRKMLRNHFGVIRYFWDVMKWNRYKQFWEPSGQDSESAIAFLPSSDAHCMMAEARIALDEMGWLERAWLCNAIHDSMVFVPRADDLDEFLPVVRDVMTRRYAEMRHPSVAPEGFSVEVECKIGRTMADCQTVDIK